MLCALHSSRMNKKLTRSVSTYCTIFMNLFLFKESLGCMVHRFRSMCCCSQTAGLDLPVGIIVSAGLAMRYIVMELVTEQTEAGMHMNMPRIKYLFQFWSLVNRSSGTRQKTCCFLNCSRAIRILCASLGRLTVHS